MAIKYWLLRLSLVAFFIGLTATYSLDKLLPFYDWTFHSLYCIFLISIIIWWRHCKANSIAFSLSWIVLLLSGGLLILLSIHSVAGVPLPSARTLLKWAVALWFIQFAYWWGRTSQGKTVVLQLSEDLFIIFSGWTLLHALFIEGGQEKWMVGPFGNAGVLGNFLIGLWPYKLAILYHRRSKKAAWTSVEYLVHFVLAILGIISLTLTWARAAWIGAGAASIIVFWLSQSLAWRLAHARVLIGLLIVGVGGAILLLAGIMKPVSALGRLHIFTVVTRMAIQGFPSGLGIGQVYVQFNEFQAQYFEIKSRSWDQQLVAYNTYEAFNSVLQIIAECGLFGLLLYSTVLTLVVWAAYRLYHTKYPQLNQIGALGAVTSLFISSGLSNPFHHWPILLIACWSIALLPIPALQLCLLSTRRWFTGTIWAATMVSFVLVSRYLYGAILWHKAATSALTETSFSVAEQFYHQAYPYLSTEGGFLYNYGSELSVAKQAGAAVQILQRARHYYTSAELYTYLGQAYEQLEQPKNAAQAFQHASRIVPAQLYPRYRLFLLYRHNKQDSAAWQVGSYLLKMPIKIPSIATQEMQRAVQQEMSQIGKKQ